MLSTDTVALLYCSCFGMIMRYIALAFTKFVSVGLYLVCIIMYYVSGALRVCGYTIPVGHQVCVSHLQLIIVCLTPGMNESSSNRTGIY